MLDWFALLVLVVLTCATLGGALLVGYFPGHIAKQRRHPQEEAVRVCGWLGLLSLGLLLPVAYIWAFWNYDSADHGEGARS